MTTADHSQPATGARVAEAPPENAVAGLARWVLDHRKLVMVAWAALFLAGAGAASHVSKRLSVEFSLPGQPGYETSKAIARDYGSGAEAPPAIVVVTVAPGETVAGEQTQIAGAFEQVRARIAHTRVVDYGSTRNRALVSSDGRTTYAFLYTPLEHSLGAPKVPKQALAIVSRALAGQAVVSLTGFSQLADGESSGGPGVFVETLIGGVGALAVLAFVFASLLAFIPLLMAAVSILTTFLVVLGLTYVANVSFIVQFLIALVGLGVAIDYSLLIVTRWREERAHGRENSEAVIAAMSTAGRAVLLSGLTVAIGLLALVVLPVPGLRSVGYGGMLIPLISIAVALTLLPAVLGGIGPRVDWPHIRHEDKASRSWTAWSRAMVRRRVPVAATAVAILAVLIIPVFHLTTGESSASALAKSGPAHDGYQRIVSQGAPGGVLTPVEIFARSGDAAAVASRLATVPGMADVLKSNAPDSNRVGTTVLIGIPHAATVNASSLAVVRNTRSALTGRPGVLGVTGVGAIELDYQHAVFGNFPLMFAVIAILTIALLARAFRSIVLATKAVILNLISMAAAFGFMTWFWQDGHGSSLVFGVPATGALAFWLPLLVFAFLFGLSMDYEVFILTRIREEYDRSGSTDAAIITGLGRTGRLVTSAALILFLAFASLASAPNTDIKVLATGLGAGILLDATIIRALLLPALVSLLGRWNWWLPRPLASALRVPASGLASRGTAPG